MRYRKLSPSGDYTWGQSALNFWVNVPQAVGQAVGTRLKLWQGEYFLDTLAGTPYVAAIIGKHPQSMADTAIQDVITGTEGVADISQYSSTIVGRNYAPVATIDTIYGPVTVNPGPLMYPQGFVPLTTESGSPLETESGEIIVL